MSDFDLTKFASGSLSEGTLVFGPLTAILAIGLVTLLCRLSGYWLIGFVPIGGRLRRAFEMLPGSIAVATGVPIAIDDGFVAVAALLVAFLGMRLIRIEALVIAAALGLVIAARAFIG